MPRDGATWRRRHGSPQQWWCEHRDCGVGGDGDDAGGHNSGDVWSSATTVGELCAAGDETWRQGAGVCACACMQCMHVGTMASSVIEWVDLTLVDPISRR